MDTWTLKIPIRPMASPRPRFARKKNYVQTYMPAKYEDYKNELIRYFPNLQLDGAVKIDILFFFKISKTWSKKKKKQMLGTYHTQKPDRDNLDKSILDAMQNIVFKDDAQIVDGRIAKFWASNDLILIKISELKK